MSRELQTSRSRLVKPTSRSREVSVSVSSFYVSCGRAHPCLIVNAHSTQWAELAWLISSRKQDLFHYNSLNQRINIYLQSTLYGQDIFTLHTAHLYSLTAVFNTAINNRTALQT